MQIQHETGLRSSGAGTLSAPRAVVDLTGLRQTIGGYRSLFGGTVEEAPDTTTDAYAADQEKVSAHKVLQYLLPRVKALGARNVLDVGCGVGAMVRSFLDQGYDAYGVDLPGLHRHWTRMGLPADSMFIVDPVRLRLPFADGSIDFAYTLGVIEHVGTTDGQSTRVPNYHELRQQWLREVFRVIRPGGAMLIGGPNRQFPIDVAHGLDSRASSLERWLSSKAKASVHKTWGANFLWAYGDIRRYLKGLPYRLEAQPVAGFLECGRVPAAARPMVQAYIDKLPKGLQGTGFNPWVLGLVHKPAIA